MITVWHHQGFPSSDINKIIADWWMGQYRVACDINSDQLRDAWQLTQNIEDSWAISSNPMVISTGNMDRRSSMVGDIFEINGKKYVVAMVGYTELPL